MQQPWEVALVNKELRVAKNSYIWILPSKRRNCHHGDPVLLVTNHECIMRADIVMFRYKLS